MYTAIYVIGILPELKHLFRDGREEVPFVYCTIERDAGKI